jgi:hypothetical protein
MATNLEFLLVPIAATTEDERVKTLRRDLSTYPDLG